MKKYIARILLRILDLCDHDWDLGMYKGNIHKICLKCKKLINTEMQTINIPTTTNDSERCGNKASHWKGDLIGKSGVHVWMNNSYGKPKKCEHCGIDDPKKTYDWANIDHKYRRKREDFIRLCRKCHRIYDMTPRKRLLAIKNLTWSKGKSDTKLTIKDVLKIRKELSEGLEAIPISRIYGVSRSTIMDIKHNRTWKTT